jgi:hypothetical protein
MQSLPRLAIWLCVVAGAAIVLLSSGPSQASPSSLVSYSSRGYQKQIMQEEMQKEQLEGRLSKRDMQLALVTKKLLAVEHQSVFPRLGQSRFLAQVRAARADARERNSNARATRLRGTRTPLAKLSLVAQAAPGSPAARLAAAEEGLEFDAWVKKWHQTHPGASLAKEKMAWHAREVEMGGIAAWEDNQRNRVAMKVGDFPTAVHEGDAARKGDARSNPATKGSKDESTALPSEEDSETVQPLFAKVLGAADKVVRLATQDEIAENACNSKCFFCNSQQLAEQSSRHCCCTQAEIGEDDCNPASTFWYENSIAGDKRPPCKKAPVSPSSGVPVVEEGEEGMVGDVGESDESSAHIAQPTVLGSPDGIPDFNGADAIIAHLPNLGWQPTDLEERGGESRGSFSVVMKRAGFDQEGDAHLQIYGPVKTPISCEIRGYRKLSGDFQGNVITTGFVDKFSGEGSAEASISPGVANEFDVLTCRDLQVTF